MSEKENAILSLHSDVRWCSKCPLFFKRNNAVPGEGNIDCKVMVIGDFPSIEDDGSGTPFTGRIGQLLEKMLAHAGLKKEDVFLTSLAKCCPYEDFSIDIVVSKCIHFVQEQIKLIQPKIIIAFGSATTQKLLGSDTKAARGVWQDYNGIKLMPTFHPAYLLEHFTDENKNLAKEDFNKVKEMLKTL